MNKLCECCWTMTDLDHLGELKIMGRVVRVCQDCVNYMWHGRTPLESENIAGEVDRQD